LRRLDPAGAVNAIAIAGIAAYLIWSGAAGGTYTLRVLSVAGIYGLAAIGYQFIFGHAGALALSQGTFMGLGAYVSGILALRAGLPFDLALPFSVGAPVMLALLVAAPVLRLQTHYFALATLMISTVALLVATEWRSMTGGANGLGGVPGLQLLGVTVRPGWPLLATVWSFVALGAVIAWWIARGRLGHAWACMRAAPNAAAAIGLDAGRLRLLAFLLSAAYAGLAGSLYVHVIRVVSPDALAFPVVIACLTIVVVGSRLRPAGALLGALLVVQLPEWFRDLRDYYLLAYGVILLLVIVLAPAGLLGTLERGARLLLPRPREPAPAPVPFSGRSGGTGTVLTIAGLSKRFGGVAALSDVSLQVRAGEALGLIGPNGSGKTTLINLVSGLYRPDAGRVLLGGADVTGWRAHHLARDGIGRTFQTVLLVDELTALDNVALARTGPRERALAEAAFLLERMGAIGAASALAGELPYGVRRRVEIARALATDPVLLLLDEPAAGLNATEQADLARRLRELLPAGIALLVIEHNMAFLEPLVDQMVCLDAGRVIAAGAPAEVKADALVIEAYLGAAPAPA